MHHLDAIMMVSVGAFIERVEDAPTHPYLLMVWRARRGMARSLGERGRNRVQPDMWHYPVDGRGVVRSDGRDVVCSAYERCSSSQLRCH